MPLLLPLPAHFFVAGGDVAIASSFLCLLHTIRETETVLDLHRHREDVAKYWPDSPRHRGYFVFCLAVHALW